MSAAAEGLRGSCLCSAVAFVLTTPLLAMGMCHCGICRKHHGSAFATFVEIRREGFLLLSGAAAVRIYASSPGVERHFCVGCGAKLLFLMHDYPDLLWVAAGALDDAPARRPEYHLFVASKAPWFNIHDDLPQYAAYPADALNAQP
jgi:hypothetical protein